MSAHGGVMRNEIKAKRREVAQSVADCVLAAENGIDDAITLASALNAHLPDARKSAQLAAEVGNDAFVAVAKALGHLVRARTAMVEAHQGLAKVQEMIGLGALSFGGAYGKPPAAQLSVVSDAA